MPTVFQVLFFAVVASNLVSYCVAGFPSCQPGWDWANNNLDQNPCQVAGVLETDCQRSTEDVVGPLQLGINHADPQHQCGCNTIMYNLYMACSACQNMTIAKWSFWRRKCDLVYAQYPHIVPRGIAVPHWAYLNVMKFDEFDPVAAQAAAVGDSQPLPRSPLTVPLLKRNDPPHCSPSNRKRSLPFSFGGLPLTWSSTACSTPRVHPNPPDTTPVLPSVPPPISTTSLHTHPSTSVSTSPFTSTPYSTVPQTSTTTQSASLSDPSPNSSVSLTSSITSQSLSPTKPSTSSPLGTSISQTTVTTINQTRVSPSYSATSQSFSPTGTSSGPGLTLRQGVVLSAVLASATFVAAMVSLVVCFSIRRRRAQKLLQPHPFYPEPNSPQPHSKLYAPDDPATFPRSNNPEVPDSEFVWPLTSINSPYQGVQYSGVAHSDAGRLGSNTYA